MAVTIKDVAKHAGVSTATVSRVLNDDPKILDTTRKRVQESLAALEYNMNYIAKGLRTRKTFTIAFITGTISGEFSMHIAEGVDDTMAKHGYTMIICGSGRNIEEEKTRIRSIIEKSVDGIIVMPADNNGAHYKYVVDHGVPIVLIDRIFDDLQTDVVLAENVEGCFAIVDYLINKGFRRIGFIAGDLCMTSSKERYEGFKLAHRRHGLPIEERLIKICKHSREAAYDCMRELYEMADFPECVLVSNYKLFVGAEQFLASVKRDGRKVNLASFDDMADLAYIQSDCLVVAAQPMREIGSVAAELLLRRINGDRSDFPATIRLPVELRIFNQKEK
jgi:LacI family transcriptional regulator